MVRPGPSQPATPSGDPGWPASPASPSSVGQPMKFGRSLPNSRVPAPPQSWLKRESSWLRAADQAEPRLPTPPNTLLPIRAPVTPPPPPSVRSFAKTVGRSPPPPLSAPRRSPACSSGRTAALGPSSLASTPPHRLGEYYDEQLTERIGRFEELAASTLQRVARRSQQQRHSALDVVARAIAARKLQRGVRAWLELARVSNGIVDFRLALFTASLTRSMKHAGRPNRKKVERGAIALDAIASGAIKTPKARTATPTQTPTASRASTPGLEPPRAAGVGVGGGGGKLRRAVEKARSVGEVTSPGPGSVRRLVARFSSTDIYKAAAGHGAGC